MIRCFVLLLYAYTIVGIGYDSGGGDRTACGRPYRAGRLYQPPCDLARMGYCTQAGQLYPWKAVRKFVKDNQGLMRRMYGDQRHGHVLRAELEDGEEFEEEWEKNEREAGGYGRWRPEPIRFARYQHDEIDNDLDEELDMDFGNSYAGESRYLRGDLTNEDVLNTKFVISEQEAAIAIKLAELKAAAHFRHVPHRTTSTRRIPLSTSKSTISTTTTTTTTITPKTSTSTPKQASISTTEYKNGLTTSKTLNGVTAHNEDTTISNSMTKMTTKSIITDNTEGFTLTTASSTAADDFIDRSTTDTTTDRTTEKLVNTTFTITKKPFTAQKLSSEKEDTEKTTTVKSTTGRIAASDRLGVAFGNEDSVTIEVTDEKSDSDNIKNHQKENDGNAENFKNSDQDNDENFDQTVESSENGEVYSDTDGNIKQGENDNSPAVLFQDMEEEPPKKKMPTNFNKMKGVNACPVKEEVVAPFWANNTRGEVLALLNMYPFEQYVHWEKCTFEHRQMYCREGCRCEQQYRLHRLLAYDPSNECRGIFSDWFRFPSCCVCKCYDIPAEFRVTSRSPRFQLPYAEKITIIKCDQF